MCQSKKELKLIRGATVVCFLFGILGVVLSIVSGSRSILFDGLRSFIQSAFILYSGMLLKLLYKGDTEKYPFGYSAFEPFFIIVKVFVLLCTNCILLVSAVKSMLNGGYLIKVSYALVFALISFFVCIAVYIVLMKNARALGSPLLKSEAINWLNDVIISSAMLVAIALIKILEHTRFAHLAVYADGVVTIVFIGTLLPSLVKQLVSNTKELLSAAPPKKIQEALERILDAEIKHYGFKDYTLYCTKTGRMISATIYIELYKEMTILELDLIRGQIIFAMKKYWEFSDIDIIFSLDTTWMDLNDPPKSDDENQILA